MNNNKFNISAIDLFILSFGLFVIFLLSTILSDISIHTRIIIAISGYILMIITILYFYFNQ